MDLKKKKHTPCCFCHAMTQQLLMKKDSLCSRSLTKTLCLRSVHSAFSAARCLLAVSSCSAERKHDSYTHGSRLKAGSLTDGGTRTSQVSVKVVHPLYLSFQFVPHRFLQSLPLGWAFHQGLISFRYPLDLQLQLLRKCEMMNLSIHSTVACFAC